MANAKRIKWTDDMLAEEALRYETRGAFQKGSKSAYNAAQRRGLLGAVCGHMEAQNVAWTDDMLAEEALKYETRGAFHKGSPSAYGAARSRGLLDAVCSHMDGNTRWTEDMLAEEALRYETRGAFSKGSPSAYQTAQKRGLLAAVCSHMVDGSPSDNDAIYLWQAKGEQWLARRVYKIGTTSARLGKERIKQVAKASGFQPIILRLVKVNGKATDLESQLLELGKSPGYVDFDGCTEFRAMTDDELDLAIEVIDFCDETGEIA